MKLIISNFFIFLLPIAYGYLSIQNGKFSYNGNQIFLSGVNIAWNSYGRDFGSGAYSGSAQSKFETWLGQIATNGGNVARIWLHVDGSYSPKFDSNGYATGADTNSLITELGTFLDKAAANNVFVIIVLWNGAATMTTPLKNLFWDNSKLQTYIDKTLTPLVNGLKTKKALAAWEVVNEPEGSVQAGTSDSNSCYDTTNLSGSGAGWTGISLPMKNILNFINLQSSAIRSADPKALVTVGSWSERPQTNACSGCRNYYTNACLSGAGQKSNGYIDFYQMHTYTYNGAYSAWSPMKKSASNYGLDKPLVIGEFATVCSELKDSVKNFQYGYNNGYVGILSWQYNAQGDCSDSASSQNTGMSANKNGGSNGAVRIYF